MTDITYGTKVEAHEDLHEDAKEFIERYNAVMNSIEELMLSMDKKKKAFIEKVREKHPEFDDWDIKYNNKENTVEAYSPRRD